ncbi:MULTISPECIES: Tn7 transposase TnsA N-terminal domain-containing protein [unclassified Pseudomonas]|uniref:Tn7 transposase TnsA N-terminal domain-containing protein n=1 Tax=unclassified Pseudomonas TaxID=196821 RepID=UPI002109036D|nr:MULTISPECIES: Tn7 transposase TnsA N-terminal domain-containing protein [unclassified Pseudomonas]
MIACAPGVQLMVTPYDLNAPHSGYTLEMPKPLRFGRSRKLVTFVASRKNQVSIGCETLLEADFCIHLEYQSAVAAYQSQPFTIRFSKSKTRYTPDFLATLVDGNQVVYEVKSDAGARNRNWQIRRAVLEQLFSQNDLRFECVEQCQFDHPVQIHNLRMLYHLGYDGNLARVPYMLRLLQEQPEKCASIAFLLKHGVSQADLTCALFNQQLHCHLHRPLNLLSWVW